LVLPLVASCASGVAKGLAFYRYEPPLIALRVEGNLQDTISLIIVDLAVCDGIHNRIVALTPGAHLGGAELIWVDLEGADLRGADLSGALLIHANLREADLRAANLGGSNLSEADLSGAHGWTDDQLRAASSLKGTTMPYSQKYPIGANP
jgi:hypothetical protein